MSNHARNDHSETQRLGTSHSSTTYGVDASERENVVLDDLRAEIIRLADAVERQNELLEAQARDRNSRSAGRRDGDE